MMENETLGDSGSESQTQYVSVGTVLGFGYFSIKEDASHSKCKAPSQSCLTVGVVLQRLSQSRDALLLLFQVLGGKRCSCGVEE